MKQMILNLAALAVVAFGAADLYAVEPIAPAPVCCSGGGINCCGANGCSATSSGCAYW
ncbi:MAG: hypothetical protein ABW277_28075 [Longimicrobiaceae bacterium]